MNPDYLKYVFVYFLTDPQYDAKTITQKINQTIEGKESVFAPFSESYLTSEAEYQNPIYFYAFIILLGVGLITVSYTHLDVYKRQHYTCEISFF